jgi:hypothetical protein
VPETSAEIVEARKGERLPYKVVFSKDGRVIAERPVASREGGRKLIANLLPLLQKHDEA